MTHTLNWSDNQKVIGPFLFAWSSNRNYGFVLDSGADEDPVCTVRVRLLWLTLIVHLPPIISPYRKWKSFPRQDGTVGGYWDEHPVEYGFNISDGYLFVRFGPQTHDSETTKDWVKALPWLAWRFHRHSLFDIDGNHFYTQLASSNGHRDFQEMRQLREQCGTQTFAFHDFDAERLTATTRIEEREWRFGDGWFSWLSLFRRHKVRRSLDIQFSGETGVKKGSWKGGTTGHGIDMREGELHEGAFRRYCDEHNMTFVRAEQHG